MFKNYFKIACRNLWRHKGFTFLNILGLSVGLAVFFLIFLYVRFETSYDSFNTKADRIYRVVSDLESRSETLHWASTAAPVAIHIKTDFPEVASFTRLYKGGVLVRKGDTKFQESNTVFADSTLFKIFDLPLIAGNRETMLKDPLSIVLSETTAKKYFGNADPLGQTLIFTTDNLSATVTGIMKDIPENSSIKADMFVSLSTMAKQFNDSMDYRWRSYVLYSYLLLEPHTHAKTLEAKLPAFIDKHLGEELKRDQEKVTLKLEPLRDVYLKSDRSGFVKGNINNVYIFSIVAVFILLIAAINFINLTTARSAERAKEVGIRKVVGAERFQLARQFLGESLLISLISFVIALPLCSVLLPLFNQMAGKTISTGIFSHPVYVLALFGIALSVGLLAGLYPALILSSFNPIVSLKGRFSTGTRGLQLRKVLVVTQFAFSITLIIGTIVVYMQLNHMRSHDLGFTKEQMMVVETRGDDNKWALRQEVASLPNVLSTSFSMSVPGRGTYGAATKVENTKGEMQPATLELNFVDFGYLEQYKLRMAAGRTFSNKISTDSTQAIVLNEKAARLFGYASPQEAIGKRFSQWGSEGMIIGVVKDFNFTSLQDEIKPLSMRIQTQSSNLLSIHVNTKDLPATIAAIESKWNRIIPSQPFSYFFLDEDFNEQYRSEEQFGNLFLNFAILTIFISCLGLLGLASYSTIQRTKEVGIRKAMGASAASITLLLSSDFLKLVLIAFLVAMPIAWLGMHQWLEGFAYRTTLSWWIFATTGLATVMIAFVTISYQAIRAALVNPIRSLRTE
ncbi:FtsX-like permease family protein [Chitinophaga sp. SYP-B3965]|uniref:ABC transporter permease n=1 Tax=Chitinophaga sp. SYP-B3965 TaxID=2663120 RepID=UPI0012999175|nr:ABC transporter permease [Chitinophaga sp. SYP-B3965]MRG45455.1 FtsX-like permease family protein [Chitinophaga sp. SYP-B3965]